MKRNSRTVDPLIDEVQRVKRELEAEFDNDPAKLLALRESCRSSTQIVWLRLHPKVTKGNPQPESAPLPHPQR